MTSPAINEVEAHRFFSAHCFNRAWDLIRRAERTDLECEQMLGLSQASLWHWTQRLDCTPRNLSIGHWQLARVYALLGQAENAMRSATSCLQHSEGTSPFFIAYAHEALARAAMVAGDNAATSRHLTAARHYSTQVASDKDRALLEADLQSLESS